jgi:hypothetical protein
MSYVPAGKAVNHWQSEAPNTEPIRNNNISAIRSGSRRNYGPNRGTQVLTGRTGKILQGTLGQYGNYLLYRDQVNFQKAHMAAQRAKEQDLELQQGVGAAANALLVGPSPHSPGKKKPGGGGGRPQPPSVGPPRPAGPTGSGGGGYGAAKDPFGKVATDPFGNAVGGGRPGAWRSAATFTPTPGEQYGRAPGQPTMPQGNTNTPDGPQGNDQRLEKRKAGGRISGTLSNVEDYPTPRSSPFLGPDSDKSKYGDQYKLF